jgi:AcrR family transcriptional regulator
MSTSRRPGALAISDAGPPPRRGRPRDAGAGDRILRAAFRQIVDVGYGALSIEAVAAEAGVAKTTIYRRYPSKRDLVIAALGEEVPFPAPAVEAHGRDALEQFVRQAIVLLIESGAVRILGSLLVEEQREPGILAVFRERILGPRRALILEMLQRGIERGEIRPDIDPLVVTEMIAGAVFGHHVILGMTSTEDWIRSLVDHVWASIAANPGTDPSDTDARTRRD